MNDGYWTGYGHAVKEIGDHMIAGVKREGYDAKTCQGIAGFLSKIIAQVQMDLKTKGGVQ